MASATINGVSYSDGISLSYAATGKYCTSLSMSGPASERDYPSAPGISGTGIKDFGKRSQSASVTIEYILGSESAIHSAYNSDSNSMSVGTGGTCTLGGITWQACTVECGPLSQPKSVGFGNYRAVASISITRHRFN